MAIAFRILRDTDRAEDAVQQALVTAWRELPMLRDDDRFDAWLRRILVRVCYAEARRHRRYAANVRLLPIDGSTARTISPRSVTGISSSAASDDCRPNTAPSSSSATTSA